MYVQYAVDLKYQKLGEAVELRTYFEVVVPSDLQAEDGGIANGVVPFLLAYIVRINMYCCPVLGADVHFIGKNFGLTQFQQDFYKGLDIKQAGDAVVNNQIKDETVIGGAAEVACPIGVTDRVQAHPFGEMRIGLEGVARIGSDVYFGALDPTPAMSRDPVTGHRYPVNVEQAQDRGMLFSLGYDYTQVEKSRFLPSDSNASHEPTRSRTRMGMTFKRGSWSVFGGLTMMGKEFKDQDGEQVLGSIRLFSRF